MKSAIELDNLSYHYDEQAALFDDFSLKIEAGDWVALVGHNGSGKSTLAKLVLGLLEASAGQIKIFGQELSEATLDLVRGQIGMVFQNPDNQFVGATVADDVAFGLENLQVPSEEMPAKIQAALEQVGMLDFADREPHHLSGGQKQRVALASVLALQPKIIILDEATAMLDPEGRQAVMATLQDLKERYGQELTLITITHDMDEAALADRIVVIDDGQLALDGRPDEVFTQGERLHELGLDLPFAAQLSQALRVRPDHYLNQEELVSWLLNSSK
ncbi:energy-coupling factor transporter ATPase [Eupransor demetentiae]|uniref:Energy-coupling factor transporter ATP-binding protein EcfA2 (EcfA2) n=1 Tax=Eupransor demetentiae TaxID=3109584 RepID=A0ABM9N662_9LACO|nr:Energy-coupling factor transporter ATP-binding protein EcfA2 (EcfA2) [Lactobacillaceae bacterium LMG 33000]